MSSNHNNNITTKSILGALLATLASGASISTRQGSSYGGQSSACPYNYPTSLTTTNARSGLIFTISSGNPATDHRAVQLRPAPYIPGGFFGGIDDHSPVLLANLKDKGLYSQALDDYNQLHDLGPTGYINQRDVQGNTTRYSFAFADASVWPGHVEQEWSLEAGSLEGVYGLYHDTANEISHGFMLCDADIDLENGAWKQLFYARSTGTGSTDIPGCEYVGVRATVAPKIENGVCSLPPADA